MFWAELKGLKATHLTIFFTQNVIFFFHKVEIPPELSGKKVISFLSKPSLYAT